MWVRVLYNHFATLDLKSMKIKAIKTRFFVKTVIHRPDSAPIKWIAWQTEPRLLRTVSKHFLRMTFNSNSVIQQDMTQILQKKKFKFITIIFKKSFCSVYLIEKYYFFKKLQFLNWIWRKNNVVIDIWKNIIENWFINISREKNMYWMYGWWISS